MTYNTLDEIAVEEIHLHYLKTALNSAETETEYNEFLIWIKETEELLNRLKNES